MPRSILFTPFNVQKQHQYKPTPAPLASALEPDNNQSINGFNARNFNGAIFKATGSDDSVANGNLFSNDVPPSNDALDADAELLSSLSHRSIRRALRQRQVKPAITATTAAATAHRADAPLGSQAFARQFVDANRRSTQASKSTVNSNQGSDPQIIKPTDGQKAAFATSLRKERRLQLIAALVYECLILCVTLTCVNCVFLYDLFDCQSILSLIAFIALQCVNLSVLSHRLSLRTHTPIASLRVLAQPLNVHHVVSALPWLATHIVCTVLSVYALTRLFTIQLDSESHANESVLYVSMTIYLYAVLCSIAHVVTHARGFEMEDESVQLVANEDKRRKLIRLSIDVLRRTCLHAAAVAFGSACVYLVFRRSILSSLDASATIDSWFGWLFCLRLRDLFHVYIVVSCIELSQSIGREVTRSLFVQQSQRAIVEARLITAPVLINHCICVMHALNVAHRTAAQYDRQLTQVETAHAIMTLSHVLRASALPGSQSAQTQIAVCHNLFADFESLQSVIVSCLQLIASAREKMIVDSVDMKNDVAVSAQAHDLSNRVLHVRHCVSIVVSILIHSLQFDSHGYVQQFLLQRCLTDLLDTLAVATSYNKRIADSSALSIQHDLQHELIRLLDKGWAEHLDAISLPIKHRKTLQQLVMQTNSKPV